MQFIIYKLFINKFCKKNFGSPRIAKACFLYPFYYKRGFLKIFKNLKGRDGLARDKFVLFLSDGVDYNLIHRKPTTLEREWTKW
jgi:hypothetical protein